MEQPIQITHNLPNIQRYESFPNRIAEPSTTEGRTDLLKTEKSISLNKVKQRLTKYISMASAYISGIITRMSLAIEKYGLRDISSDEEVIPLKKRLYRT